MMSKQDRKILRELAARTAEIAALPEQEEKRRLWRLLNARRPQRPMVMIDQVCWNEMNFDGELTLHSSDPECREYEERLRRILFQWKYFSVDMVVDPFVLVFKAIENTGFGIDLEEETAVTDPTNSVVGHKFHNQFQTDEDLAKLQMPRISHLAAETARRIAMAHELFDDLLAVKPWGMDPYLGI